jgi:hypothetical protein
MWLWANLLFWAMMSFFWLFYAWASRPSTDAGDR